MEYGTVSGVLRTPADFSRAARALGADRVWIEEDADVGEATIEVSGMSDRKRHELMRIAQEQRPAGVKISVEERGDDQKLLTDKELITVISALPDDWEPGDDIEMSYVDWDQVKPLADEYGGFPELLDAVKRSTTSTEAAETDETAVHMENVSTLIHTDETSSASSERREMDAVDEAKQAYVEGSIDILELEDRLEDTLDPDPISLS